MFDPYEFEAIDWDDDEDENGNLVHCLRNGVDERVVSEVLRERPVEITLSLKSAEFSIVGPDSGSLTMWTLLFDRSYKRGDWLRPVTGWPSNRAQIVAWQQITRLVWRNKL